MFYMLHRSSGAEDDGSAWEFRAQGTGYAKAQIGPLALTLLQDGRRAFGVGVDVVLDEALARELERIAPGTIGETRIANVRGPQPELEPRPPMLQLLGAAVVHLAQESIVKSADGKLSLQQPYVLEVGEPVEASVCKIAENGVTIFSPQVRDLLAVHAPHLAFKPVRFRNEEPLCDDRAAPETLVPSAAKLKEPPRR